MGHDVKMPQMGESITEGTISTWLKKVGETVAKDEPLFEISTDKVDAEIPSPAAGVLLEIKAQPGQTVPIDTVVAVLGNASDAPQDATPKAAAATATAPAAPVAAAVAPQPTSPAQKSSPVVRKIAAEHQVDLRNVPATGLSGRVTKQDIEGYLQKGPPAAPSAAPIAQPARAQATLSVPMDTSIPETYLPKVLDGDKVEDLPMMRQKIAEHMVISKRISPHVATVWEMDMSQLVSLRARFKKAWQEKHGVNLTYTAFILKATVDALKAFPAMNASTDGKKVIYHGGIHLGLAVALDGGLIVPVIHGADELNLLGLARRAADLATRARNKKLKPNEVQGGTFTVSNPGSFGPMFNVPVINQPQVGILGVGTVEKRPAVIDDMIAIRTRAYMSLSFDHRLIDGALGDQFMARIKKGLEEFDESEL